MVILGINAYHGDVAAALLRDGELVAAVEEERFRRIKHYAGFPRDAIQSCLASAGIEARDVDAFAVSRDPNAHLWRKALFALRHRPSASLIRDRAANATSVRHLAQSCATVLGLDESHVASRMHYVEHHAAHLASSYFASPFDDAAVCAIDGFGDFVSTSTGIRARDVPVDSEPGVLSALPRTALPRHHAVSRVSEVRRRIQGHGTGAVRRTGICGPASTDRQRHR
jgi:carbamoyltransferase